MRCHSCITSLGRGPAHAILFCCLHILQAWPVTTSHWRILLPLAYMAGLFLLSSVPGDDPEVAGAGGAILQWLTPQWQNLLHIPIYAGPAASWLWALAGRPRHTWLLLAFVLTVAWAVFDESYQTTVPGRYGSVTDLALNVIGASLAVALAACGKPTTARSKPKSQGM